ncbi:efflux RND transporter permease subunit [endosymbiont of unidentified scaly snail isolate Monju]|uniref:efflux RND transporter permease subunit n=1 Tax=endosymbiont of unidentified scaly snail isolate Monju TaxID=1248727 RepID=UPI0003892CA9|nr:CusA/CzcA family heavy metal efflux RND transporter [endosymbiont of unidentified scaly snail isolate Monju]BAN68370.1 RND superfamily heavy metal efflux transporter subunit [endosymbiont of unidentified scaly snail isolate Monju]
MLNRLIDWSVANRLLVLLGLLGVLGAAAALIPKLNLDAFPDVTNVQVQINTEAQGLAAEEVEQLITYPIEAVMYALPDVEEVRSISKTGLSVITVVFKEGTDIYFARQLVFERLQDARGQIPEGVGTPEMGPNTSGLGQVYQYILRAEDPARYDVMTLRSLNDWVVKQVLLPVPGITGVLSYGGEVRQYQVQVDPRKLLAYDVSLDEVRQAIEDNNRNAGGWYLDRGAEQLVIRGVGWVRPGEDGLRDIASVPLKSRDGVVVRVGDIARVTFGGEIRQGAVTMTRRNADGEPEQLGEVVAGIVLKRLGANTKATIDAIEERLPIIRQALPEGVSIEPFYDQGVLVEKAVDTVTRALAEAFVLIVAVLLLFLMNLRATVLVLISVPLSVGLALTAMSWWGLSANLMSLGGLAIAIGMMVDGSVVMMENIFKHLSHPDPAHEEHARRELAPGDPDPYDAVHDDHGIGLRIQEAAREVGRPVFYAVIIIVVVFAPLFALEGVEGKLFQPMAISIVLAMLTSLVVALVVMPALASFVFRRGVRHRESPVFRPLEWVYRHLLRGALRVRGLVVGGALALFVGAMLLLPRLGTEFVPELEEGTINIRTTLAPSASLDTALSVAAKLERQLMQFPEVVYVSSRIGRPELGGDPEPVSNVELYVGLKPVDEWTSARNRFELQQRFQEVLSVHPGLLFTFSQPIATRVDELLSGVKAALAIKLFGPDLEVLAEKGREIEALARRVEGTRDVEMEQIAGEAQLVVRPKRDLMARYGISVGQIMDLVADGIGGTAAGQVIQGNERYDIYVRLAPAFRSDVASLRELLLQSPTGAWVRLGEVAEVGIESGPPQIRRDDVQRRVVIQSNVEGRDMGGLVAELRRRIAEEIDLPPGYSVVFGGQFENQQRAQTRLMIVVPVSLGLIFLLLYFAFHSMGQAALIMLNVPLALIGGIAALYWTGQYLSVPGSIGFIALFGVAVLNGVVMVNAINQNLKAGMDMHEAVYRGALSRLRPVLMTAFIAALGLIPMLLSHGVGSEVQRPLATVVVGGLVSSTLLTLFILPSLYPLFSRIVAKERGSLA